MEHFFSWRFHTVSSRTRHSSSSSVIPRGFSYRGSVPFRASRSKISMTVSLKCTGFLLRSHIGNTCAAMGTGERVLSLTASSPSSHAVLYKSARVTANPHVTTRVKTLTRQPHWPWGFCLAASARDLEWPWVSRRRSYRRMFAKLTSSQILESSNEHHVSIVFISTALYLHRSSPKYTEGAESFSTAAALTVTQVHIHINAPFL